MDQLTAAYKYVTAQLEAAFASLRQAAIAKSSQVATATLEEGSDARVSSLVTQLRALRELVTNLDARLTDIETQLERQPATLYEPL